MAAATAGPTGTAGSDATNRAPPALRGRRATLRFARDHQGGSLGRSRDWSTDATNTWRTIDVTGAVTGAFLIAEPNAQADVALGSKEGGQAAQLEVLVDLADPPVNDRAGLLANGQLGLCLYGSPPCVAPLGQATNVVILGNYCDPWPYEGVRR